MADKSTKAAIARKVNNKLRPGPPREFICLVGGPTNPFNGWYCGVYRPSDPDGMILVGGPPPVSRTDIQHYLKFKLLSRRSDGTPYIADPKREQEMREHGWWRGSYDEVVAQGWKTSEVVATPSGTHDIYWGNFAVAASRLYTLEDLPEPLVRPEPRRGDIVTFLVYAPPYEKRQKVDYNASPYNWYNKDKPILNKAANPRAAEYWKYTPALGTRLPLPPVSNSPTTITASDRKAQERVRERDRIEREAEKVRPISEEDVNFHILMQMTADRDDKYLFRINGYDSYRDWMESKCLGSVKAPDVLAKVIFFNDSAEFISYCNSGKFPRTGGHSVVEGTDYSLRPMRPVPHDIYGRPLPRTAPWLKHWNSSPDVDRSQIKICRFDYFGHSDSSEMMLEYGWSNQKGEVPVSDVGLSDLELFASFPPSVLTADAHAALWGCYLGESGGIGPGLAKRFRGGVCAADVRTDFSQIVVNDTEMPYPVKDEWNAAGVHRRNRGEFKKFPYAAAASTP